MNGTRTASALRHWRPVTLGLLVVALGALAVPASREPSFGWDRAVAAWLLGFSAPAYDAFMEAVSIPGEYFVIIVTMLVGAALAARLLGWRAGLLVLVGLGCMGVNEAFKDIVDRPRPLEPPMGGGESFPSGHTLHAMLTVGLLWLLVMPKLTASTPRRLLLAFAVVWPALVGLSRVHLERHWPSDVLGAWVFGAGLLILMGWVWARVQSPTAGEGDGAVPLPASPAGKEGER